MALLEEKALIEFTWLSTDCKCDANSQGESILILFKFSDKS